MDPNRSKSVPIEEGRQFNSLAQTNAQPALGSLKAPYDRMTNVFDRPGMFHQESGVCLSLQQKMYPPHDSSTLQIHRPLPVMQKTRVSGVRPSQRGHEHVRSYAWRAAKHLVTMCCPFEHREAYSLVNHLQLQTDECLLPWLSAEINRMKLFKPIFYKV